MSRHASSNNGIGKKREEEMDACIMNRGEHSWLVTESLERPVHRSLRVVYTIQLMLNVRRGYTDRCTRCKLYLSLIQACCAHLVTFD